MPNIRAIFSTLRLSISAVGSIYTEGIDVAKYQDTLQWYMIPPDVKFCIVKLTEGMYTKDELRAQNISSAKSVGMVVSPYHFFRSNIDPTLQARNFINEIEKFRDDLSNVFFVDCETKDVNITGEEYARRLLIFIGIVENETGMHAGIYTSPGFWNGYVVKDSKSLSWTKYDLWVANWQNIFGYPSRPGSVWGWGDHFDLWQYKVQAIWGDVVDRDRYNGDATAMKIFFGCEIEEPPVIIYPQLPIGTVITKDGLRIRTEPNTGAQITDVMPYGTVVDVIRTVTVGANIWAQIGYKQYCAVVYNGSTLLAITA